jgi:putative SOS response-associated peptidase YedK
MAASVPAALDPAYDHCMCGRFVTSSPAAQVAAYFDAEITAERLLDREPNFNVAPTTDVAVVVERDGRRGLALRRWGLVPSWAKDPSVGSKMINARVETAATKPSFRSAFTKRRCIIPVDGFYEWKAPVEGTRKQPYFITRRDREPLAFAGLWESWKDPDVTASGESPAPLLTCSILTTEAVGPMAEVHHRMPVLLGPDAWDAWLDESVTDREQVQGMVLPAPEDLLEMWPVSTAVNSVRNKGAELVDPVGPDTAAGPDGPPTLF